MRHRFRFVIAGAIIILVNQVVSFAVSASAPPALLPEGSTHYAASSLSTFAATYVDGWTDMPGMTKYFTIPGGATADVLVQWCGEMHPAAGDTLAVRAIIAGTAIDHVNVSPSGPACMLFQLPGVAAGTKSVKIQWWPASGFAYAYDRALLVTLNIH